MLHRGMEPMALELANTNIGDKAATVFNTSASNVDTVSRGGLVQCIRFGTVDVC